MGTGIENIGFGSKSQWFELNAEVDEDYIEYRFNNYVIDPGSVISGVNLIDDSGLKNLLLSAPSHDWAEILQLLQSRYDDYYKYYNTFHSFNMFYSITGQKPIFIAYKLIE